MSTARLVLLAAVAGSLLAPGTASAGLGWHDASTGVPDAATLNDVAVLGMGLVAVGKETVTVTDEAGVEKTEVQAAIYRLVDGAWQRDVLTDSPGEPILGELVEVAGDGATAWAVGMRGDDTPQPLLVKPAAAPGAWEAVPVGDKPVGRPLSVGVSSAGAWVGDDRGQLWPLTGGTVGATPTKTARDAAIHGLAVAADGTGVAVADGKSTDARIFNFGPAAPLAGPAPALPDTADQSLVAVARQGTTALAVDTTGYWTFDGQAWTRSTSGLGTGTRQLTDLSLASGIHALAGKVGADGHVWRRTGTSQSWSSAKVTDGAAINGIAAISNIDVWAVGEQGVVVRYHNKPDPQPECSVNCGGGDTGGGGTGGEGGGGGGTGGGTDSTATSSTRDNTTTAVPPAKAGDPTVYVVEPERPARKRGGKRRKPARLLDRVKVVRRTRSLLVSFRLRAPARVAVSARRGRALVSRARSRKMRPGRRRVVLRFRGKPPTALRIVVRPLRAKKAR